MNDNVAGCVNKQLFVNKLIISTLNLKTKTSVRSKLVSAAPSGQTKISSCRFNLNLLNKDPLN